ncbi:MAG: YaaA family protein [Rikenellaceae bacterium]
MLLLLSPAKTIRENKLPKFSDILCRNFSEPEFAFYAQELTAKLAKASAKELAVGLKINEKLAEQNFQRYQMMLRGESLQNPAVYAYNGIVFKNLDVLNLSDEDVVYANSHICFTSFLYGLLSPLDLISPYRLEGDFRLERGVKVFDFWKGKLTDSLIARAKKQGGVLCNLASEEMKNLFDWGRVVSQVEVIEPEFKTQGRGIVVHTKMARGLMARYIIQKKIDTEQELQSFNLGGYNFSEGVYQR